MKRRYLSEQYWDDLNSDNSFVTTSNIARVFLGVQNGQTGIKRLISREGIGLDHGNPKKPSTGKALKSFNEFLSFLDSDNKTVQEFREAIQNLDFETALKNCYGNISNILNIHDKNRHLANSFFESFQVEMDEFSTEIKTKLYSLLAIIISNAFDYEKYDKVFLEELIAGAKKFVCTVKNILIPESDLKPIELLFERLSVFTIGHGREIYDKDINRKNANQILESIIKEFEKIFYVIDVSIRSYMDYTVDGVLDYAESLVNKSKKLEEIKELDEIVDEKPPFSESDFSFKAFREHLSSTKWLYDEESECLKKEKIELLLFFEKLFYDFSDNPTEEKSDKLSTLFAYIEPETSKRTIFGSGIPFIFFKENEIRALRLFLASIFAGLENPGEAFKVYELKRLAELQSEMNPLELLMQTINNQLLVKLARPRKHATTEPYRFEGKEDIANFLHKIIMDIEYSLSVRDINTGFEKQDFEKKRYFDGKKWFLEESYLDFDPNYIPDIRPHSLSNSDQYFKIYEQNEIDPYINHRTLASYKEIFLNSPLDDIDDISDTINESLVEALFEEEGLSDLMQKLKDAISIAKKSVDNKYQILEILQKIGTVFNTKPDEISLKDLTDVFSLTEELYTCFEQFIVPEIKSLNLFLVINYLGLPVIYDWHFNILYNLSEYRKKYEEVLSSLLPYIDGFQNYLTNKKDKKPETFFVLNQIEIAKLDIFPGKMKCLKETRPDEWLISHWETLKESEKLYEEKHKIETELKLSEQKMEQEKALIEQEIQDLEEFNNKPFYSDDFVRNYYAKFKYSVLIAFIVATVVVAKVINFYVNKEEKNEETLFQSKEVPEKTDLLRKYENAEMVFMNDDANDSFGYKVLANYWEGIENTEEAKEYFDSLSESAKRSLNFQLKAILENLIERKIMSDNDLISAKELVAELIRKKHSAN